MEGEFKVYVSRPKTLRILRFLRFLITLFTGNFAIRSEEIIPIIIFICILLVMYAPAFLWLYKPILVLNNEHFVIRSLLGDVHNSISWDNIDSVSLYRQDPRGIEQLVLKIRFKEERNIANGENMKLNEHSLDIGLCDSSTRAELIKRIQDKGIIVEGLEAVKEFEEEVEKSR